MTVVSNTSPIGYLVLIGSIEILPRLFGKVVIPSAVWSELLDVSSPEALRNWMAEPPEWLDIEVAPSAEIDAELARLHAGEREAIRLAKERNAELILLDEKAARRVARERGLRVAGLLGVLDEAGRRGWLDVHVAIEALKQTTFRAAPSLLDWLSDRHR